MTAFEAAAATTPVSLCVGVLPLQQSTQLGQTAQWVVGAWTVGGNVPDFKLALQANAGAGIPGFSFGCGSGDGTSVCDLGAVDASSAQRQLQAEVTIPVTASVTSVSLTVTASAASLPTAPTAAASVIVLAPTGAVGASLSSASTIAPVGVAAPTPAVSAAAGNAAGLFPTVAPGSAQADGASPVANVSSIGGSHLGSEIAEVGGLAALGVAMLLAITRLSIRRPAPRHGGPGPRHAASSAAAPPAPAAPAAPPISTTSTTSTTSPAEAPAEVSK